MKEATAPFLEYGVIGALCILLMVALRFLYLKTEEHSDHYRKESSESKKLYVEIAIEQNKINTKLIEIREKDVEQNKNYHVEISKKLDEMPGKIVREIEYRNQNKKDNLTSAS